MKFNLLKNGQRILFLAGLLRTFQSTVSIFAYSSTREQSNKRPDCKTVRIFAYSIVVRASSQAKGGLEQG